MKIIRHMLEQPFVLATGLAALIHSTWSLGTLFSGTEPAFASFHWFGWIIPALLIAFALDVGQIATSADIRSNGLTISRAVTFGVFSLATWYLQWLYIAHHMPALELAAGISEIHRGPALFLRDMAMWFIPALLPLSTMLYTISGHRETVESAPLPATEITVLEPVIQGPTMDLLEISPLPAPQLPAVIADDIFYSNGVMVNESEEQKHMASCTFCDWAKTYDTAIGAQRAARAHERQCSEKVASNGHIS